MAPDASEALAGIQKASIRFSVLIFDVSFLSFSITASSSSSSGFQLEKKFSSFLMLLVLGTLIYSRVSYNNSELMTISIDFCIVFFFLSLVVYICYQN